MSVGKLGLECGLYYTADNEPGGTLVEVLKVGDVEVPFEHSEVDISDRGSYFDLVRKGTIKSGAEFEIRDDGRDDATISKFRAAFLTGGDPIYMQILDAKSDVSRFGIKGYFEVMNFSRSEKRSDKVTYKISIKPTYFNSTYPSFVDETV